MGTTQGDISTDSINNISNKKITTSTPIPGPTLPTKSNTIKSAMKKQNNINNNNNNNNNKINKHQTMPNNSTTPGTGLSRAICKSIPAGGDDDTNNEIGFNYNVPLPVKVRSCRGTSVKAGSTSHNFSNNGDATGGNKRSQ